MTIVEITGGMLRAARSLTGLSQQEFAERASISRPCPVLGANWWYKMTRTELIIQLLKVVIGFAFGAYFIWWSLEVLDRLTPDNEVPAAVVGRAS